MFRFILFCNVSLVGLYLIYKTLNCIFAWFKHWTKMTSTRKIANGKSNYSIFSLASSSMKDVFDKSTLLERFDLIFWCISIGLVRMDAADVLRGTNKLRTFWLLSCWNERVRFLIDQVRIILNLRVAPCRIS